VSCAVAAVVYTLHGFDGYLSRDLGVYAYGGQQVAEGVPPYAGILNRAGPLAHLVPGIAVICSRAIGVDDILGARVLFMLLSVASIGTAYLLGRDLFRARLAGLATAAAMLSFEGFSWFATYGPREKTTMVLFTLLALLAMVHQRWATAGCFIALGTLTWQPVFFGAIAGVGVAILLGVPSRRPSALLRVVIGGLVPTTVTVLAYLAVGKLQLFLDDFLLINARYTSQSSMFAHPQSLVRAMTGFYGWSAWVFLVGSLVLVALSVRAFQSGAARRSPESAALVGVGVVLVVDILWSMKAFNGGPDAFCMLPCAAVGVGGLIEVVWRRTPPRVALAASLTWVLAATAMALVFSFTRQDDTLVEERSDVAAVVALLPSDHQILSVESAQVLVLAQERNLTRYQLFGNGLIDYLDATWPGGRRGYARWISHRRPTVITVGTQFRAAPPPWLRPVLRHGYVNVGDSPGWIWYVRADLGPTTLRRLWAVLE
jgi:hypothetical protein